MNAATRELSLWIDNDQGMYEQARELARGALQEDNDPEFVLADRLEGSFEWATDASAYVETFGSVELVDFLASDTGVMVMGIYRCTWAGGVEWDVLAASLLDDIREG